MSSLIYIITFLILISSINIGTINIIATINRIKSSNKPLRARKELKNNVSIGIFIPTYNEGAHAEKVIEHISKIEEARLKNIDCKIYILDDSNDGSTDLIRTILDATDFKNPVFIIHRDNRDKFKAGALNNAIKNTDFDYIAVFDSDFHVDFEFITESIVELESNSNIAFTQGLWGFTNRDENNLTKAQGYLLDYHFMVMQNFKSEAFGMPHFNGTGGVWRASVLKEIGGWSGNTVSEDVETSYKAFLRGFTAKYIETRPLISELPNNFSAYATQQSRWAAGTAGCFKIYIKDLLTSPCLPFLMKMTAVAHLSSYFFSVFIVFMVTILLGCELLNIAIDKQIKYMFFMIWGFSSMQYIGMICNSLLLNDSKVRTLLSTIRIYSIGAALIPALFVAVIKGIFLTNSIVFERTPKNSSRSIGKKNLFTNSFSLVWLLITILMAGYSLENNNLFGFIVFLSFACYPVVFRQNEAP